VIHLLSNQASDAEVVLNEALTLRTELVDEFQEGWRQSYRRGSTLNNLGILFCETDRATQAKDVFLESVRLRREVQEMAPDLCRPGLVLSLSNLGRYHRLTGSMTEAQEAYKEAIKAGEVLYSKAQNAFGPDLVRALSNYYILVVTNLKNEETAKAILTRLRQLGIEKLSEEEEWAVEDLESL
jgi:tetratricopeptide (TPR) repeat protein